MINNDEQSKWTAVTYSATISWWCGGGKVVGSLYKILSIMMDYHYIKYIAWSLQGGLYHILLLFIVRLGSLECGTAPLFISPPSFHDSEMKPNYLWYKQWHLVHLETEVAHRGRSYSIEVLPMHALDQSWVSLSCQSHPTNSNQTYQNKHLNINKWHTPSLRKMYFTCTLMFFRLVCVPFSNMEEAVNH